MRWFMTCGSGSTPASPPGCTQQQAADRGEFVTLSPRLWGGGTLYGELGTVSFATVAEALDAPLGSAGGPTRRPGRPRCGGGGAGCVGGPAPTLTRHHGRRLARQLVTCVNTPWPATAPGPDEHDPGGQQLRAVAPARRARHASARPRPLLLATIGLDALLDQDATPGWLLHTLTGGRMKIATHTLQQLVNERGADLRSIVLDDTGQIVGVGRRTSVPPGWLREAIWARDTAVRDPDGTCPVRRADLDHINPWPPDPPTWPTCSPPGAAGTTARPPNTGPSPAPATAPPPGPTAGTAGPSDSHPPPRPDTTTRHRTTPPATRRQDADPP
jgi:hypothetical protein